MLHATRETGFTLSKYARQHIIQCDIDSTKICDIMNIIMVKHCNVSVCGYNKLDDVYWGKKCNRGVCELDFQIVVKNLGHNNSNVVITSVGEQKNVSTLYKTVKEVIRISNLSNL